MGGKLKIMSGRKTVVGEEMSTEVETQVLLTDGEEETDR